MGYVIAAAALILGIVLAPVLIPLLRGEAPTNAEYGMVLLVLAAISVLYGLWKDRIREGMLLGFLCAGAGLLLLVAS